MDIELALRSPAPIVVIKRKKECLPTHVRYSMNAKTVMRY